MIIASQPETRHQKRRAAIAGFSKALIPFVIGIGCLVLPSIISIDQRTGHAIMVNSAANDVHRVDAAVLEREIRTGLPLGSSLSTVVESLRKRRIEFSFEASSKTVYAIVRNTKGGTIVASESLTLQSHFDDA